MTLTFIALLLIMGTPAGFSRTERALTSTHEEAMRNAEVGLIYPEKRIKHGRSKFKIEEYLVWNGMLQRCYNPNRDNYKFYGGLGVRVHIRWHNPVNFQNDVGKRPTKHHTLDRWPDKFGHYGPDNFRWALKVQQANNAKNNVLFSYNGEEKTISQWSRIFSRNPACVRQRISVYGWTFERAILTPTNDWKSIGNGGLAAEP